MERRRRARQTPTPPASFDDWLPMVSPTLTWDAPHLAYIRERLERVTRGECKRLMLFVPPRHGKSEMTTIRYPVYRLECEPSMRVILGAYNATLAQKFSRKARNVARTRLALNTERTAVEDWETTAGGGLRAVGVGGGVTGMGANLVIIDDPVKSREEAESATYRDRCWDWYRDDLYTRLEPDGAIVLIQTRWHEDDLAGRLLAEMKQGGEAWETVTLPALADEGDPLGRAPGDALWPERYDATDFERIRTVLGTYSFEALYQQRPRPAEGALFKRQWFKVVDAAPYGLSWVRYWDLAASTRESADFTASPAVAMGGDGTVYVRDMIRGRWEWPDAYSIIVRTMQAEPNTRHGVEKALHGLAAVQELMRDPRVAHVPFEGVDVDKDKFSRALAWAGRAEAGKVALVQGEWVGAFLDEVTAFPLGAHDDQVDTISGGVQMVAMGEVGYGPALWN